MKKLQIYTLAAAALAMGLAGCSKDVESGNITGAQFGDPTWVDVTLQAPATRGLTGETENGVGNENLITMLEFYVFDDAGTALDPNVKFGGVEGYYKVERVGNEPSVALSQKLKVSASTTAAGKKMIVAANMNLGPTTDAMNTYDEVSAALSKAKMIKSLDPNATVRKIPDAGLEMSGQTSAVITAGRGDNAVTMEIVRLVNKIQEPVFTNLAGVPTKVDLSQEEANFLWGFQANGTTPKVDVTTATITYAYQGYVVINGLDRSNVRFVGNASGEYKKPMVTEYLWNTWAWDVNGDTTDDKVYQASEFNPSGFYTNVYSGKYGQDFFLDAAAGPVYAFENKPKQITVNNLSGHDADAVYSFIIKGELTANGTLNSGTRYWRINLIMDDNYHMMRNVVYKTYVQTVNTPGYNTPKEAEDSVDVVPEPGETSVTITVKVSPWDVNEYETQM